MSHYEAGVNRVCASQRRFYDRNEQVSEEWGSYEMPDFSNEVRKRSGFYAELGGFSDFSDFADPGRYLPAPDDWCVVIADIRGSTKAVQNGRYKDVNMVGACCITAVVNIAGDLHVPYVFWGGRCHFIGPP